MPHRGTCTRKVTRVAPQADSKRRRTHPGSHYASTAKLKPLSAGTRRSAASATATYAPCSQTRHEELREGGRVETPHSLASAPSSLTYTRTLFLARDNGQAGARRHYCQQPPSLTAVGNQKFSKEWCIGGDSSARSGPTAQSQGLALCACCKAAPHSVVPLMTDTSS